MSDEPIETFAAWFINDHGQVDYELAETEIEAAKYAAWADGDGRALGLQRADGSTVRVADWPVYTEVVRGMRQAEQDRRDNPPPPIPRRRAVDPFEGRVIHIETAEPDWLGRA